MAQVSRPENRDSFQIAIVCALPVERHAVEALLDANYEEDGFSYAKAPGDANVYTLGRLGNQHVVLTHMPAMGINRAAAAAAHLCSNFCGIKVAFVVGICGGVPRTSDGKDIFLGDVIISKSVVWTDFGWQYATGFKRKENMEGTLGQANSEIKAFVDKLSGYESRRRVTDKTNAFYTELCRCDASYRSCYPGPSADMLYPIAFRHKHRDGSCSTCNDYNVEDNDSNEFCELASKTSCKDLGCDRVAEAQQDRIKRMTAANLNKDLPRGTEDGCTQRPSVHFGKMASGSQVLKSGLHRDTIASELNVIGFEMESAGIWETIPTVVIKSVSDYADCHKSKNWQQ